MSKHRERIPQVIAIDVTDEDYGDDEEEDDFHSAGSSTVISSSNVMQKAAPDHSLKARSNSSSASDSASDSDDNALFESEGEGQEEKEATEMLPLQSRLEDNDNQHQTLNQPKPVNELTSPTNFNSDVERILKAFFSFIKKNKSDKQNEETPGGSDIDFWALQHGLGFYMSSKFHCYYNQDNSCNASFPDKNLLSNHLDSVHKITKDSGM